MAGHTLNNFGVSASLSGWSLELKDISQEAEEDSSLKLYEEKEN